MNTVVVCNSVVVVAQVFPSVLKGVENRRKFERLRVAYSLLQPPKEQLVYDFEFDDFGRDAQGNRVGGVCGLLPKAGRRQFGGMAKV